MGRDSGAVQAGPDPAIVNHHERGKTVTHPIHQPCQREFRPAMARAEMWRERMGAIVRLQLRRMPMDAHA